MISLSFTSFWVHFHVGLYICRGTKLITDQHLSYYSRDTYEVYIKQKLYIEGAVWFDIKNMNDMISVVGWKYYFVKGKTLEKNNVCGVVV